MLKWAFQYCICSLIQTEAVDCDALSTPLFKIEASGLNSKVINVYVSKLDFYYYAPSTCFPKSISTLAQACCTVLELSLKYTWSISTMRKQVLTLEGVGLSIGSIRFYLNISARMENTKI